MIGMCKTTDKETTVFYYYHHTQEEVDPAFRDTGSQIFLLVFAKLHCVQWITRTGLVQKYRAR